MKWLKYLLWTLFAGIVFYYLIILGGPIRNLIDLRGCTASYTHYLTNNAYCNWSTDEHCPNNADNLSNARREVARCLCENASQNKLQSKELLELIQSDAYLRGNLERIQIEQGISLDSAGTICDYREILFSADQR